MPSSRRHNRHSSHSRPSSSSSKESRGGQRRPQSRGSRCNSRAGSSRAPDSCHHLGESRTQAPYPNAPTYGAYFYQASPRPPQASRPRSRSKSRSSAPPYEKVWTCRASNWRSELIVVDRTRGVFGGVDERTEFPISVAYDTSVDEIVRFLTEGRRGTRVMVLWSDGAKEILDGRLHSVEELTELAERLELKYEERVHWKK